MDREAEFLHEQASIARIRMRMHASALGDEASAPFRLASLVRQRPAWTLGGALVAGFLSGLGLRALVGSQKTRSAVRRIGGKARDLAEPSRLRELIGRVVSAAGQGGSFGDILRNLFLGADQAPDGRPAGRHGVNGQAHDGTPHARARC